MWSGTVVVAQELAEDDLQLPDTEDEAMGEQLAPHRTDPALGEGIRPRSAERQPDYPHGFAPEDLVEGSGELGIPITKEELGRELALLEPPGQVPRLLNDPIASWRSGAADHVHFRLPTSMKKST
jgi:hypothetical protein